MKQRIVNLVCAGLALIVLTGAPLAIAETGADSNSADTNKKEENTEKTKTESAETKALRERLEKKKTEFKIRLSQSEKERLISRCKPAQALVKTEGEKFDGRVVVRTRAYAKLIEKLNSISGRLEAMGIDVTELKNQLAVLETKTAKFNTDLAAYKQALSDLRAIDCVADPDAFKAALETARSARDTLLADAADIKNYVQGTIKATLQAIRAQLDAQEKEADNT